MFYYLEGKITLTKPGAAVIECNGVGYLCHISQNTESRLKLGKKNRLYTYLYLKEGGCELYGFFNEEERSCFRMLISVSGVGPRAAISVLSLSSPDQLALAIITEDTKLLTQAPGIGKKIAQRIVLELRDQMGKASLPIPSSTTTELFSSGNSVNHTQEAVAALMVLGYTQPSILRSMESMDTAQMETEDIIRQCLKRLTQQSS